jgi:RNA polymerase sigma-70 factor (ECF subfamily)
MTGHGASSDPRDDLVTHLADLRAFANSLTRDAAAADDLVQETIVKAWTKIDQFERGTNMRAWLITILRNTFYSQRRRQKREVPDPDGDYVRRLYVRPAHDDRLAFNDFTAAFDQLSPEHREVLVLIGVSGFSYEEAAHVTGVAIGTVKSRTNRARQRLCELLGLEFGETLWSDIAEAAIASPGKGGVEAA